MGRHKKKKKSKQIIKGNLRNDYIKGLTFDWKRDCHKAHYVSVGDYKVFICGLNDIDERGLKEISTLDLFVGLDSGWREYSSTQSTNPFIMDFQKLIGETLTNLYVHQVSDYSVDHKLAHATIEAIKQGWKIGFGCIGAHGRTGWLLGRLLQEIEGLTGEDLKNAIRIRLCKNALEGATQFEDLGIKHDRAVTQPYLSSTSSPYVHRANYDRLDTINQKESWIECPNCNSRGTKDGYPCTVCEGSGIVLAKEKR